MVNKKRKTSSYYILKKDEVSELKEQRDEIILNTSLSAFGALSLMAVSLSSNVLDGGNMSMVEFLSYVFSGSITLAGTLLAGKNSLEYKKMKEDFCEQAAREGRVR